MAKMIKDFKRFYCKKCGGEIRMITRATPKLRHIARCVKCGVEARKVKELMK